MSVKFDTVRPYLPKAFENQEAFIRDNLEAFFSKEGVATEEHSTQIHTWMIWHSNRQGLLFVKMNQLVVDILSTPSGKSLRLLSTGTTAFFNLFDSENLGSFIKTEKTQSLAELTFKNNELIDAKTDQINYLFQSVEFDNIPKGLATKLKLKKPAPENNYSKATKAFNDPPKIGLWEEPSKTTPLPPKEMPKLPPAKKDPSNRKMNPFVVGGAIALLALTFFLYYKRHAIKNTFHYITYGSH